MKRVLAAAVIALLVPWFAAAQAAGRSRTPKGPPQPNVPYDTQAGRFIWNPNTEILSRGIGRDSSVVADSVSVNPRVMDAKNPRDKGTVYYLDQGLLMAYFPQSADRSGGERTMAVTKETTRTFNTIDMGDYAGVALISGSRLAMWKVDQLADYVAADVQEYAFNPSFGKEKCGPGKFRPFAEYPIFIFKRDGKVDGFRWNSKEAILARAEIDPEHTYTSLGDFLKKSGAGSGDCKWVWQK